MGILAKIIYSTLILGILGVLFRELWVIWFDTTVYIGRFDVVSDTGKDDAASANFPKRISGAQAILAHQFNDYQTRGAVNSPSDPTFILPGMVPLLLPPEVLAGVDIIVQNVNLRQILSSIRKSFLSPNEVSGNVSIRNGSVLAAIDWPNANRIQGRESTSLTKFLIPSQSNEQAVANYIACSIAWAQGKQPMNHIFLRKNAVFTFD